MANNAVLKGKFLISLEDGSFYQTNEITKDLLSDLEDGLLSIVYLSDQGIFCEMRQDITWSKIPDVDF
jgi:hypothetical protein